MPQTLTEAQKNTVKEILSLLLDLPKEEKSLSLEVEKLKRLLTQKEIPENKDDYFRLQQCYQQPTTQFLRLEEQNPELCIGSVQEYVLECIEEQIKEAAQEAKVDTQTLPWDKQAFLETLHRPENVASCATVFHTQKQASDYDPLHIPVEPGKIYKAKFIKDPAFRLLHVEITIDLPGFKPLPGEKIYYPDYVDSQMFEDDFARAQQPVARAVSELIVEEILLNELMNKHVINARQKFRSSAAVKKLMLYRFYYHALANKRILFADLSEVLWEDVERLLHPGLMTLIDAGKLNVGLAPYILDPELAVIQHHYYLEEILNNRLPLESIVNKVTPEQSYFLTLVGIIYLQKMGKLSFELAKTLPSHTAPIFLSEACLRLIMEDKLLIDDIKTLSPDQARLTADSYYAGEYFNQRLDVPTIRSYSPEELRSLLHPPLIELQQKGILSRDQAKSASPMVCELLDDEFYFELILSKGIEYDLIKDVNPHQVAVLTDPKIKQLIGAGVLEISEALPLKKIEKETLIKPAIKRLFTAGKIKLKHLDKIPLGFAPMLDKNICFYSLINQDVLSMEECLRVITNIELLSDPLSLWSLNFGGRLFAIFKNKTFQINERVDDFASIKKDLDEIIEANPQFPRKTIIKQAIVIFSRFLRQKLAMEFEIHLEEGSVYIQFLKELLDIEYSPEEEKESPGNNLSITKLGRMAEHAKQKIQLMETQPGLAQPFTAHSLYLLPPPANNKDLEQIKAFYHSACDLLDFNLLMEVGARQVQHRATI